MAPFPPIHHAFNSASLWASVEADLQSLYQNPHTGAVTTRTACSSDYGFMHDEKVHQHIFFTSGTHEPSTKFPPLHPGTTHPAMSKGRDIDNVSTLNTLGYSPLSLKTFIEIIKKIQQKHTGPHKPVIFSVAGDSSTILNCFLLLARSHDPVRRPWEKWCMEINLSCPNIQGKPPPAYSPKELARLLQYITEGTKKVVIREKTQLERSGMDAAGILETLSHWNIPIGIKLPPYTYSGQFDEVTETIREANALSGSGSQLLYEDGAVKALGIYDTQEPVISTFAKHKVDSQSDSFGTTIDPASLTMPQVDDIDATLAFDLAAALSLDDALSQAPSIEKSHELWRILTPPFPISFVTAVNTLGSCAHLSIGRDETKDGYQTWHSTLNSADGLGLGGLAGASLHPLALGNIKNLKLRLSRSEHTRSIKIIGVGGVKDAASFRRMRAVGADAVALATALGAKGPAIFEEIFGELNKNHVKTE